MGGILFLFIYFYELTFRFQTLHVKLSCKHYFWDDHLCYWCVAGCYIFLFVCLFFLRFFSHWRGPGVNKYCICVSVVAHVCVWTIITHVHATHPLSISLTDTHTRSVEPQQANQRIKIQYIHIVSSSKSDKHGVMSTKRVLSKEGNCCCSHLETERGEGDERESV